MISVQEAHRIIKLSIPDVEIESIPFSEATNRVLAEEICASFSQPRFNNSSMDGFAVRHLDLTGASKKEPVILKSKEVIPARIIPGECIPVMTGARIPSGADAVVIVEDTSGFKSGVEVRFFNVVKAGENIRFEGEEIQSGEPVLLPGARIQTSEISNLATFGYSYVKVYRQPRMTILVTGDELKQVGEQIAENEIYDSNLPLLKDLAERVGAMVISVEMIPDNPLQLKKFLATALSSSDMVVSSGGISMGRFDYIRNILSELNVTERFWGVAQKPGKPLFFGTVENTMIFGLPGNPVSAFICFMEYVWPTCELLMGLKTNSKLQVELIEPFPRDPEKHRFLFGQVWAENGFLKCSPALKKESHMTTASIGANSILESYPGDNPLRAGEPVVVSLLPWKTVRSKR